MSDQGVLDEVASKAEVESSPIIHPQFIDDPPFGMMPPGKMSSMERVEPVRVHDSEACRRGRRRAHNTVLFLRSTAKISNDVLATSLHEPPVVKTPGII
jgi:hypothetical protein